MQRTLRDDYCKDARKRLAGGRPLSNQLDAVTFNGDGRTDRASLQRVTRLPSRASLQRVTRLSSVDARSGASTQADQVY